jgi:hypothetical protein
MLTLHDHPIRIPNANLNKYTGTQQIEMKIDVGVK